MKKKLMGLNRNVIVLGFTSFLNDVSSEMIKPILPIFLTVVLGAPIFAVGLIEGIAYSTASLFKVASGWYSDKIGRRKIFVVSGYGIATLGKTILIFATNWWYVLVERFTDKMGKGIRDAPRDAIIAETKKSLRGRAFGLRESMDRAGAILGPLIAIFLLSMSFSYQQIFMVAIIPGILATLTVLFFVKEHANHALSNLKFRFSIVSRECRTFLLISGLFYLGFFSFAFLILKTTELGFSAELSTILYLVYAVASTILSTLIGMLSDKIGRKPVIVFGYIAFGLMCLGFTYFVDVIQIAAMFILFGVAVAVVETVPRAYVSEMTDQKHEGTLLGMFHTVNGIVALPASLFAGLIWQFFGSSMAFYYGAGLSFLAALLLIVAMNSKA